MWMQYRPPINLVVDPAEKRLSKDQLHQLRGLLSGAILTLEVMRKDETAAQSLGYFDNCSAIRNQLRGMQEIIG